MLVDNRPIFLNLLQIRLPMAGIVSIIHRITGVVMALAIPYLLYLFALSVESEDGFEAVRVQLATPLLRLLLFFGIWSMLHHLLAGIRYLLIDIDVGVGKPHYRHSAWAVIVLAPVLALVVVGGMG